MKKCIPYWISNISIRFSRYEDFKCNQCIFRSPCSNQGISFALVDIKDANLHFPIFHQSIHKGPGSHCGPSKDLEGAYSRPPGWFAHFHCEYSRDIWSWKYRKHHWFYPSGWNIYTAQMKVINPLRKCLALRNQLLLWGPWVSPQFVSAWGYWGS